MTMPTTVLDIIEDTVAKYPHKTAVKTIDNQMTYDHLREIAMRLGYALDREIGGKRNVPIVIFIDKGCECLATMLGVLYSGNCYVPMDIKTPIERLQSILATLGTNLLITTVREREKLEKMGYDGNVLIYEQMLDACPPAAEVAAVLGEIKRTLVDMDLMYILFTSGSTGIPKGVAIRHRSVLDYVQAFTAEVPISEDDTVGNQVPFYVDMSLKDIYMSLKVGATICVIPQKYFMTPKKMLEYLEENHVTMLMWVPTAYNMVARLDALSRVKPSGLQKFLFSGEGMPIPVYSYWRRHYPDAIYIQQYGPTEITGACTTYMVTREYGQGETIPIGKPFKNTSILLFDEEDKEVTRAMVGIPGEICVSGTCLAAGYYNNREKTEEVFVQNPLVQAYPYRIYRTGDLAKWDAEGNLVFVSRKDYQIKHGGRRVELGEIETAVYSVPAIKECCCVHNAPEDIIVLYYAGEIDEKDLRTMVKEKLPQYMIPAQYIKCSELPKLANGKLDRKQMTAMACEEK